MAKTFKDKKTAYGGPIKSRRYSQEKSRSRRFDHYKRFGPDSPQDSYCRYCGNNTEFEAGFLVCQDCGGVENAFLNLTPDRSAA